MVSKLIPLHLAVRPLPLQRDLKGTFHVLDARMRSMLRVKPQGHSPFVGGDEQHWLVRQPPLCLPESNQVSRWDITREFSANRCARPAVDDRLLEFDPFRASSEPTRAGRQR